MRDKVRMKPMFMYIVTVQSQKQNRSAGPKTPSIYNTHGGGAVRYGQFNYNVVYVDVIKNTEYKTINKRRGYHVRNF